MELQFSKSSRGNEVLRYEGFDYIIKRNNPDRSITWRCRMVNRLKCGAMMKTFNTQILTPPTNHSHYGDPLQSEMRAVKSRIRENAGNPDNHSQTKAIIAGGLSEVSDDVLQRMPQKAALEEMVRNQRRKQINAIPNPTRNNFDIPEKYLDIILFDSGKNDPERILGLGKRELVECLLDADWFCDGTFELVPEIWFQLYTIHAKVGSSYPPCIYYLLPNKTIQTYRRMLQNVKELLDGYCPRKVVLDFEIAAMSAFRTEFHQTKISGCFFHLSQSIMRKVAKIGLKKRFDSQPELNVLTKCLPALSFVPEDDVLVIFQELGRLLHQNNEEDDYDDPIQELLVYFEHTYIRGPEIRLGEYREAKFPPSLWNHFRDGEVCAPKTTNACEGFHNSLKSLIQSPKPTIWKF